MDKPIYRMQGGEKVKMVSLNEGRRMTSELIAKVREMKMRGEWADELKRQKLENNKLLSKNLSRNIMCKQKRAD